MKASGLLTPNGTGIERTWVVANILLYPNNRVVVYNKNGQQVFVAKGYKNNWAGTFKGASLPAGSYYYKVFLDNNQLIIQGWMYILY